LSHEIRKIFEKCVRLSTSPLLVEDPPRFSPMITQGVSGLG